MRSRNDQLTKPTPNLFFHRSMLSWIFASLCLPGLHLIATPESLAQERSVALRADQPRLQRLVDDLRARLSIPEAVAVSIVPSNPLMMSVAAPTDTAAEFQLAIEAAFLDALTDDELEAAIAHELGHVWVFTHHPYLQTEGLANQIATRVVGRGALERVYEKVWKRGGTKGDIVQFLGPQQPVAGLAADDQPSQTTH
jgi:hypothetical protein